MWVIETAKDVFENNSKTKLYDEFIKYFSSKEVCDEITEIYSVNVENGEIYEWLTANQISSIRNKLLTKINKIKKKQPY